ncbi:hypothetical protein Q8A67_016869 [Cirrhinus molitorella]|uniref:Kappa-casein n=1 Tax=Cirrhinus molitorella TaxID=172907 RepID=A0AA88PIU1_9TELE|nr:hypothetical protein Q8A67_016869 [Cirrhinus molitorella]
MRISPQCFFILTVCLTSISATDETLYVSLYYPYGYIWVSPYQSFPVLSHYVIPVLLKTAGPKQVMTAQPPMTSATPTDPETPNTPSLTTPTPVGPDAPTKSPTTKSRRGDN